jgi:hypothetical protein
MEDLEMRHIQTRLTLRAFAFALIACALLIAAGTPTAGFAEEAKEEKKPEGVQYEATIGVVFTQVNYSDWAEGGDDALAYATLFAGRVFEDRARDKWNVDGAVGFGQSKIGGQGTRISVNEVLVEGQYNYKLPKKFSAYGAAGFRSALVTGYDYTVEPKVEKASFNDPGYYTASLGAAYDIKPKPTYFRTRMGLGFKYTTAKEHFEFGYADDPDTPEIDKSKLEEGIESVTELDAAIGENLTYASKLALFSRFQDLDIWDVRWDNTITAQINKYFNTRFEYVLLFDKDVSGRVQQFQMLSFGISYTFL